VATAGRRLAECVTRMLRDSSQLRLYPLSIHPEGQGWIVGREESGVFVEIPAAGVTLLRALQAGCSVAEAVDEVSRVEGQFVDGQDFVGTLQELGFVASIGGDQCDTATTPPSLRWLRPEHVRWIFTRTAYVCLGFFTIANLAIALLHDELVPSYRQFFVTNWQGFNVAWCTALFIAALGAHELAHLAAARSENVYARISLGTRLNFLCAQTTVSGLWGAPRRLRFRVFLAGIGMDLFIISACLCAIRVLGLTGFGLRSLQALILSLFISIAGEFALYMRTDIYYVLQEALHCKNLYADAWRYARYVIHKILILTGFSATSAEAAVSNIPESERRAVRIYAVIMVAGTSVSLYLLVFYGIPIMLTLLARAFDEIIGGVRAGEPLRIADGLAVVAVEGSLQLIFVKTFFKQHGARLRTAWAVAHQRHRRQRSRAMAGASAGSE
jgi:putative peptide zinc metalloprotease protein